MVSFISNSFISCTYAYSPSVLIETFASIDLSESAHSSMFRNYSFSFTDGLYVIILLINKIASICFSQSSESKFVLIIFKLNFRFSNGSGGSISSKWIFSILFCKVSPNPFYDLFNEVFPLKVSFNSVDF